MITSLSNHNKEWMQQLCPIRSLPIDVWLIIFSFLDIKTLSQTSLVSKAWRQLTNHEDVWSIQARKMNIDLFHSSLSLRELIKNKVDENYIEKKICYSLVNGENPIELEILEVAAQIKILKQSLLNHQHQNRRIKLTKLVIFRNQALDKLSKQDLLSYRIIMSMLGLEIRISKGSNLRS